MNKTTNMEVTDLPKGSLAYENVVFCSPTDFYHFEDSRGIYVRPLGEKGFYYYRLSPHKSVGNGFMAMNYLQRKQVYVALRDRVGLEFIGEEELEDVGMVSVTVEFRVKKERNGFHIDSKAFEWHFRERMKELPMSIGQSYLVKFEGNTLIATVQTLLSLGKGDNDITGCGILSDQSVVEIVSGDRSISLSSESVSRSKKSPIAVNVPFEDIGIGGLAEQWRLIYRRAFSTRTISHETLTKFGMRHVKGVLLYGPPGTGKSLIAGKIAQMLTGRTPKKISGSEVLSKWYGEAEQRIRDLFADAEAEYAEKGENSELHVIIIDELDAICRSRTSTHTVGDSIVNQLLAKMDGVDKMDNFLVIGMTNRKDLMDPALLRPGRFEVHIQVNLPDENGRKEILAIHTKDMRENEKIAPDVDLNAYARKTKNFSGADLAGMVQNAQTYAMSRHIDPFDMKEINEEEILVSDADFERAFEETEPAFGANNKDILGSLPKKFVIYHEDLRNLMNSVNEMMDRLTSSSILSHHSLLLEGPRDSGKTTLATKLALNGKFPMVRTISADMYIGDSDISVANKISEIFRDLYKSDSAVLILDNLESIIQFNSVGLRYSHTITHSLEVLIRKKVPGKKLFIIATTSNIEGIELVGLTKCFDDRIELPSVVYDNQNLTIGEALLKIEDTRFKDPSSLSDCINNFENPEEWQILLK
eukprot:TRINITY_DN8478_c0_g1_i1.p1 TRINITY_DN8478_c0_g1~~TRINITY_DN8478_c0_g1_i1.p1  ORF type:complete len:701 (-),score=148.39 TRINITY_DN8478_c0_g1_i1:21-2123(-)